MSEKAKRHDWDHGAHGDGVCRVCGMLYRIRMGAPSQYSADGGKTWFHTKKTPLCEGPR